MPIISACCCWDSLKTGSKASAIFTFVSLYICLIMCDRVVVFRCKLITGVQSGKTWTIVDSFTSRTGTDTAMGNT